MTQAFRYRKSYWKRRCKAVTDALGVVLEDVYYGKRPSLFDVLGDLEALYELGIKGEKLHEEAIKDNAHKRVIENIIKVLGILEGTGNEIRKVADKMGLPLDKAPEYKSSLIMNQAQPEETYEQVMMEEMQ
jgi:hypothetical protein